ncbi:MAG: GNAT family N-acetyltransferase, partial [Candidatus Aenigmarchaeota archaeon]|nr:GNAT family N-acetyltransferase [Candidatus Aenigmarchaeota archaeon]
EIPKVLDEYLSEQFTKYSKLFGYTINLTDFCALMKYDKKIIGAVIGDTCFDSFELKELIIDPDYLYLAPDFIEKIIKDLKNKNVNFIYIDTFNKQAKDFYTKLGFDFDFERNGYINDNGNNISLCYLSKNI